MKSDPVPPEQIALLEQLAEHAEKVRTHFFDLLPGYLKHEYEVSNKTSANPWGDLRVRHRGNRHRSALLRASILDEALVAFQALVRDAKAQGQPRDLKLAKSRF